MKLNWNIKIECPIDEQNFKSLSQEILKEFGVNDKEDIEFKNQQTVGSPRSLKFDMISPIDITINEIRIFNLSDSGKIKIQFSFIKILLISLLFLLFGSLGHILLGLFGYLMSVAFFGLATLFVLYMNKEKVEKSIKNICQQEL